MAGDVKFAVVHGEILSSDTGNKSFTSTGFGTPVGAIVLLSGVSTINGTEVEKQIGIGFTDGTNEYCIGGTCEDAVSVTNTDRVLRAALAVERDGTSGNGDTGLAGFNAWVTDGIQLNISNQFAVSRRIIVILLGGADAEVEVGLENLGGSTSAQTVTTTIAPDLVFAAHANVNAAAGAASHFVQSLGVSDGTTQRSLSNLDKDGRSSVSETEQALYTDATLSNLYTGLKWKLTCNNFQATSFDFTASADAKSARAIWMAINVDDRSFAIGTDDLPTSSVVDWDGPSLGFEPGFLLLATSHLTVTDTHTASGDAGQQGYSVSDGTTEGCVSVSSEDNVATTNTESSAYSSKFILSHDDGGAASYDMSDVAFEADNWTIAAADISAVNGTARKAWYLAVEKPAAGGGGDKTVNLASSVDFDSIVPSPVPEIDTAPAVLDLDSVVNAPVPSVTDLPSALVLGASVEAPSIVITGSISFDATVQVVTADIQAPTITKTGSVNVAGQVVNLTATPLSPSVLIVTPSFELSDRVVSCERSDGNAAQYVTPVSVAADWTQIHSDCSQVMTDDNDAVGEETTEVASIRLRSVNNGTILLVRAIYDSGETLPTVRVFGFDSAHGQIQNANANPMNLLDQDGNTVIAIAAAPSTDIKTEAGRLATEPVQVDCKGCSEIVALVTSTGTATAGVTLEAKIL